MNPSPRKTLPELLRELRDMLTNDHIPYKDESGCIEFHLGDFANVLSKADRCLRMAEEGAGEPVCECCGRKPYKLVKFTNMNSDQWHPMCEVGYHEHVSNADDVNAHEMDRFGGAYGLVTWEERGPTPPSPATALVEAGDAMRALLDTIGDPHREEAIAVWDAAKAQQVGG